MNELSNYYKIFGSYWKEVDSRIVSLIKQHIEYDSKVLEVGFSGGHYIAKLTDDGYDISGIEIREEIYNETNDKFRKIYPDVNLMLGNIFDYNEKYDLIYSTGLIRCLKCKDRNEFLKHISDMAPKAVYTVPCIETERNIGSNQKVGVSGCEEYCTLNIAYELSTIYQYVETGIWGKDEIGLDDDFVWYYCNNPR